MEPKVCNVHGVAFQIVVRKAVRVDQYNETTEEYEPTDLPVPERHEIETCHCALCDPDV